MSFGHVLRISIVTPFRRLMSSTVAAVQDVATDKRKIEEEQDDGPDVQSRKKRRHQKGDDKDEDYRDPALSGTSYYFDGYLRKVYPYFFEYRCWCKGRWMGRKLTEVLTDEFRSLPPGPLEIKLKTGAIRVNGNVVDVDYVLKGHDNIKHRAHRHELPVLASHIEIVHEDENMLVINKPPSIPVHSGGRFRFNTLMSILSYDYGYKDLHICHRLDRLTSGLLMFGKSTEVAHRIHAEIEARIVRKEYLCRVDGEFPDEDVVVDQPLDVLCKKMGVIYVSPNGKASKTTFRKISFNGKSSLLSCLPHTGRTHQLRVHLQYAGFPIVNDPLYNSFAFGPTKGKNADYGMSDEELLMSVRKVHTPDQWYDTTRREPDAANNANHEVNTKAYLGEEFIEREPKFDPSKVQKDGACEECDIRYVESEAKHLMMFLHALKYSGSDWSYETKPPFWAHEKYDLL